MFLKLFVLFFIICLVSGGAEEKEGVKYASRCEACKILAIELQDRLSETGKSHDIIELGYSLDDVKPKKRKEYQRSELRLIESLENVCDRILKYSLHKEREDSTRFAKGMPETFQTLHGLVNKGVKVDLGIPYELWDKPSVEVVNMKTKCETLLEDFENDIEDWYFKYQETKPLIDYLCDERALKSDDKKCLKETLKGDKESIDALPKKVKKEKIEDDSSEDYGRDEL